MNLYNNDHSRVADKSHLKQYEQDLNTLAELTQELNSNNVVVLKKSKNRKIETLKLTGLVSTISGIAIGVIILIKILEIFYVKKKLKDKKLL